MYEKLYHEAIGNKETNYVGVMLRVWRSYEFVDIVLHYSAVVDGEIVVNKRKCLDGFSRTDAELQRLAIMKFDKLVASHPAFGKG